jgi:hypothetical protein
MTLTTALALAAVAALLALALHGWWRVRRARPKAPTGASRFAASTLEERHEPRLDSPPTLEDAVTEPGALPDGVLSPAATARAALRRTPRLDALIDALVPLVLDAPVSAEQVLAHAPASRRAGSKPFYIEGLDTDTGQWEPLTPGRRYGELQAGVQLVWRVSELQQPGADRPQGLEGLLPLLLLLVALLCSHLHDGAVDGASVGCSGPAEVRG